jgi:hypothetical protein
MTHTTEFKALSLQQPLKHVALRRNLGTAAIVTVAFSGAPFGLTWLAGTSVATFTFMMIWRLRQF